ncbi:MAG TPA: cupin domain-containing protein [Acidisarcina sp.]|nr:cupin domain-containing protein [Acidisarcina sp.]
MLLSRRNICQLVPLLAGSSALAFAQQQLGTTIAPFDTLPVRKSGSNSFRKILEGETYSGAHIEVHETTLGPGSSPHPHHHHVHEEMFLLSKGTLELTIQGKTTVIGPGSAAYVHSNEEHSVRNPGTEDTQYFVLELGKEA